MDFHLKQWAANHENSSSLPLPLFSSEPTSSSSPTKPSKGSGMMMMQSGYFSMGQWQELEVQALIYRHMLTGSPIPPQLLHLLLNSSNTNAISPFNFPTLYQSGGGYWGRGGMDPEPGRCRRTDGKKWRCSRDVVAGHKYCERHIHRGRNRSRKPVEIPTAPTGGSRGDYGVVKKQVSYTAASSVCGGAPTMGGGGGGGGGSPLFDQLHLNQRISESSMGNKGTYRSSHDEIPETNNKSSGGRTLRPFFDDWPRTVQEQEMLATSLSISVTGDTPSDFSLKLSTGNDNNTGPRGGEELNGERERVPSNWGMLWGTNHAGSMGGPLAEALRSSSTSNSSSPTSVLHQLQRGSTTTSETSYVST